MSAVGRTAREI